MNPRIARFALELENFDYSIRHRRGELMAYVDAFSRSPAIAVIDGGEVDTNIQITQTRNRKIQNIRSRLEEGNQEGYVL